LDVLVDLLIARADLRPPTAGHLHLRRLVRRRRYYGPAAARQRKDPEDDRHHHARDTGHRADHRPGERIHAVTLRTHRPPGQAVAGLGNNNTALSTRSTAGNRPWPDPGERSTAAVDRNTPKPRRSDRAGELSGPSSLSWALVRTKRSVTKSDSHS